MSSSGILNPMFGASFASSSSVSTAVNSNSRSIGSRDFLNKVEFQFNAPQKIHDYNQTTKNNSRSIANNAYFFRDANDGTGAAQTVIYQ